MSAEPNVAGVSRLLYVVAGAALASWGLWGADPGWKQWTWLISGGGLIVLGVIGYSPLHALFANKSLRAS